MDREVVPGPGIVSSIEDFQDLKKPLIPNSVVPPVKSEVLRLTAPPTIIVGNFGGRETAGPPLYSTADFSELREARRLKKLKANRLKTTSGN